VSAGGGRPISRVANVEVGESDRVGARRSDWWRTSAGLCLKGHLAGGLARLVSVAHHQLVQNEINCPLLTTGGARSLLRAGRPGPLESAHLSRLVPNLTHTGPVVGSRCRRVTVPP
jgi:hypothetical protein